MNGANTGPLGTLTGSVTVDTSKPLLSDYIMGSAVCFPGEHKICIFAEIFRAPVLQRYFVFE